jgi:hypothetical protein
MTVPINAFQHVTSATRTALPPPIASRLSCLQLFGLSRIISTPRQPPLVKKKNCRRHGGFGVKTMSARRADSFHLSLRSPFAEKREELEIDFPHVICKN